MLSPIYLLVLIFRIIRQKDTYKSVLQRLSFAKYPRPQGKIVWLHAASVGESMVAITVVNAIRDKIKHQDIHFLVTTGTLSSAAILSLWLPKNSFHQFTPLDLPFVVRRFLKHWQPNLSIFIESELWPCLLQQSATRMPMILINARLSNNSYHRWRKFNYLFKNIICSFQAIMTQSIDDYHKYTHLGCQNVLNLGNLKFANKELHCDQAQLLLLRNTLHNKKIFVAASTHQEDEEVTLSIIKALSQENIFSVIVLRHPERKEQVAKHCAMLQLKYSIRSDTQIPDPNNDLYIVDTFGELGLFYSIASVVFVGGSFKRGGHNLAEPAYFHNVIILGPDMSNFQNIADDMIMKKAALQIQDADDLEQQVIFFLSDAGAAEAAIYRNNAHQFVTDRRQTINNYIQEIEKFLP